MKTKRRVLIINPVHQLGYGAGYYYYCKYLKPEFDIDFLGFDKGLPKVDLPGIKIIHLSMEKNRVIRLFHFTLRCLALTRQNEYDSIFCVYYNLAFIVGLFGKSQQKVLDIRTGSLSINLLKKWCYNRLVLLTSLCFDRTTVLSKGLADLLRLPKSNTLLLPLGAEILYNGSKIFQNRIHLLYIGILQDRSIGKTIDGFKMFHDKYAGQFSLRYDIVGFSPNVEDEEEIRYKIKDYGMEDIVRFHGLKNHEELKPYLNEATVGVCFVPQVSHFQIQPSTKIIEYALSGLITIATDTQENRRFISKLNGVICQDNAESFCDSLEKVYLNLENYTDTSIRESLIQYHWQTVVCDTLAPLLRNA